ncbi:hypothetical protein ACFYXS_05430 [Streptomyces sp. NPDC002574]|uniref:hypothetical protein n=1 Tax=Streptomyces sp. NPDC002574 TaxID=3364652 RepID=UPI0036B69501
MRLGVRCGRRRRGRSVEAECLDELVGLLGVVVLGRAGIRIRLRFLGCVIRIRLRTCRALVRGEAGVDGGGTARRCGGGGRDDGRVRGGHRRQIRRSSSHAQIDDEAQRVLDSIDALARSGDPAERLKHLTELLNRRPDLHKEVRAASTPSTSSCS